MTRIAKRFNLSTQTVSISYSNPYIVLCYYIKIRKYQHIFLQTGFLFPKFNLSLQQDNHQGTAKRETSRRHGIIHTNRDKKKRPNRIKATPPFQDHCVQNEKIEREGGREHPKQYFQMGLSENKYQTAHCQGRSEIKRFGDDQGHGSWSESITITFSSPVGVRLRRYHQW